MKLPITGSCFCGAVQYEISEEPIMTGKCYCHSCQQRTGSSYYPFLAVKRDTFNIKGQRSDYAAKGSSGKEVHHQFCPICGSMVMGIPDAYPSIYTIPAGTLSLPNDYVPKVNVWIKDVASWDYIDESLQSFEEGSK